MLETVAGREGIELMTRRAITPLLLVGMLGVGQILLMSAEARHRECLGKRVPHQNIYGNGDNDVFGTNGNDVIYTGGGNDKVVARDGRDVVCAGRGRDFVLLGSGDDDLHLGLGNDIPNSAADRKGGFGELGDDEIGGGGGDDLVQGGRDLDELFGASDADQIVGGPGNDELHGNNGPDFLHDQGDGSSGDELDGGPQPPDQDDVCLSDPGDTEIDCEA
jgi:Ca2+-binding RTX toxin-like protein